MKVGKPQSKRVPVRLRHKIQKASAAKQRKQRKEAKKNPQWRSRLKKDPGIPNLFPYKDKVLAEIEEGRRRKEEDAQKRREIAKAQREGRAVADVSSASAGAEMEVEGEDEDLVDPEDMSDSENEMDEGEDSNPMAALLASAQERAQAYSREDDEEESRDEGEEWGGLEDEDTKTTTRQTQPERKALPKQALADPIKTISALLERLQSTSDGLQQILDHYQILPLVTAGSDTTSRFLVEVARKRGRLGRGGIPNLNAAALTVLGDLNDERLALPALSSAAKAPAASSKGDVQIVTQLAEPFRIEGLFETQPIAS